MSGAGNHESADARATAATLSALRAYRSAFDGWLAAPLQPDSYAATNATLARLEEVAVCETAAVRDHVRQLRAIQRELIQVVLEAALATAEAAPARIAARGRLFGLHATSLGSLALACGLAQQRRSRA